MGDDAPPVFRSHSHPDAAPLPKPSRQRRYQLKMKAQGRCQQCGSAEAKGASRCPTCASRHNRKRRERGERASAGPPGF